MMDRIELYERAFDSLGRVEQLILSASDKNTLLKSILKEAMSISEAEAGTLF